MSLINITDVQVANNPGRFTDDFNFKITFECMSELAEDIEWKLIYIVTTNDGKEFEQELDTCSVGPIPVGVNSFEFEAEAPNASKLPARDIIGSNVVLVRASYKEQEFVSIGYIVENEYDSEELRALDEAQRPDPALVQQIQRKIVTEKPKVHRYNIKW